jgi:hypothetical protein
MFVCKGIESWWGARLACHVRYPKPIGKNMRLLLTVHRRRLAARTEGIGPCGKEARPHRHDSFAQLFSETEKRRMCDQKRKDWAEQSIEL